MRCALLLSALLPIASGWRIPQTRRELLRDALATLAVTTALPKVAGAESIQERLNKFGLPPVEKVGATSKAATQVRCGAYSKAHDARGARRHRMATA
eukprot:7993980-Prorocentrum_lima.AAC.1